MQSCVSTRVLHCTGVYSNGYDASLNVKNGFPVFTTVIEANFVNRQEDRFAAFKLSDEDKQEILKLARDPRIGEQARLLYAHAESFLPLCLQVAVSA